MSVRKLNGNMNVIGTNLRHYRKAKHLSQARLTQELNLLGIHIYIWLIEANKRTVKDYELCGFVKILYITFEDLFYKIYDILDSY
jgi:transcriptional regulator with XRE-family HTH domain